MTICLRVARLVQELDSQSLLFIPLVQKETPIIVSLCEKCLVADVRSTVGQYLQLNKTSLDMFGLFVGKLECPTKHIPDEVTVGNCTEFCLKRVLFNCCKEFHLPRRDRNTLDLLY